MQLYRRKGADYEDNKPNTNTATTQCHSYKKKQPRKGERRGKKKKERRKKEKKTHIQHTATPRLEASLMANAPRTGLGISFTFIPCLSILLSRLPTLPRSIFFRSVLCIFPSMESNLGQPRRRAYACCHDRSDFLASVVLQSESR